MGLGISGVGILSNDIALNIQGFGTLDTITDFTSFNCECEDPMNPGEFDMDNCDLEPASPGFIGDLAAMVCSWETHVSEYGGNLPPNYWDGEGCDAEFWEKNRNEWPAGYNEDSLFNDLFSTNLAIYRVVVSPEQEITDESLAPVRGRVSSDEASVGTATFARESSPEDSETTNTNQTDGRTTTNTEDLVDGAVLNAARVSLGDIYPTFAQMLMTPEIQHYDGGLNELTRHAVAALLNAAHSDVYYKYDEQEIIDKTQWAINMDWYMPTIDDFKYHNSLDERTICPAT